MSSCQSAVSHLLLKWTLSVLCFILPIFIFLATAVASVSSALYPGQDHLTGHPLAVLGQAQEAHKVDEAGSEVQLAAVLTGGVVVRERMVVVVKSLAWILKQEFEKEVL